MTLGSPIGSARMAGVISAVPPDPPRPMMAAMSPARARAKCSSATAIAATALPRSPVKTAAGPSGW